MLAGGSIGQEGLLSVLQRLASSSCAHRRDVDRSFEVRASALIPAHVSTVLSDIALYVTNVSEIVC